MKSVKSIGISLKYQRSTLPACKDLGIRKLSFLAKTQFLDFVEDESLYQLITYL